MPSRNVANSGALMNENTSCSRSMMLLNIMATYAVPMLATVPKTVAIRAHPEVVRVVGARLDVGLVDVVRPDRVERRHVAGHPRHEAGQQRRQAEAEQPGRVAASEQQRQRQVVVGLAAAPSVPSWPTSASATMPGRITRKGKSIFGTAATSGVRRAAFIDFGGHRALDDEEVRAPVAERQHEAQAHHHPEPLDAHGVGVGAPEVPPRLRSSRPGRRSR